ncbi:MAG: endonuclease/exonuclease/phosphatase family protein [Pseudomonadota bacterium]
MSFTHFSKVVLLSSCAVGAVIISAPIAGAVVFINEIHYDNGGTDVGEFIELAGAAGTDLTDWEIQLYNGNNSSTYDTVSLNGMLADEVGGFGFEVINFPTNGLQNGSPDGIALIDPANNVVEFLSYEGAFVAANGAANGTMSTDIGVSEPSDSPAGFSLQLGGGDGTTAADFTWQAPAAETPGATNIGQSFNGEMSEGGDMMTELTPIYEIQGEALTSPLEGQNVRTEGIVTAVADNGFYVQDVEGDGNPGTSDALFVFTSSEPSVEKGDLVSLEGAVSEFTPGGASTGNLSTTQLAFPDIEITGSGDLPAPVVIGKAGRVPPNQNIDDDLNMSFDPATDGIDFYESVEAMLVTVPGGQVVDRPSFGEIAVVSDGGVNTTGLNDRGALVIEPDDFNPERVLIDDALYRDDFDVPAVSVGDSLEDVTGVVTYNFGNFKVLPEEAPVFTDGGLQPEVTDIPVGEDRLNVATYNVLNLSPDNFGADAQLAQLASDIVNGLKSPDVIGLQEIQDNNGFNPGNQLDGVVDASETYQALIDAIVDAGGPTYSFLDVAPVDGADGGAPGGNIRPGFLYNPDRVDLVEDSFGRLPGADGDPAFVDSRKPIVATFLFNGEEVTIVNNHFSSKGGSTPLLGAVQPPVNGSVDERLAQAAFVNAYVDGLLASEPGAKIVVLGDLNEFQFLEPLAVLEGDENEQILFNLVDLIDTSDAYSFIFEGNAQLLDHILITENLLNAMPLFDIVHLAAEFAFGASDHDPLLASFFIGDVEISEPGVLALFATGLLGAAITRRRRGVPA